MTEATGEVIPAAQALPLIATMISDLESRTVDADEDARLVQMRILEGMLAAEDEDELFAAQEANTVASKEFTEIPFRLLYGGIEWRRSAPAYVAQGQFPVFALLTVTRLDNGERVVVNAGGLSTVGVLSKMARWEEDSDREDERKPFAPYAEDGGRPLQFFQRPTQSGYDVILLKPVTVVEAPKRRSRASASA